MIAGCVLASLPARGAESIRIEASQRYERSRLHRFTFGGGYRELWKTPIEVPVLDLQREGGGLTPTARFGGNQTPVLGFRGRDGRDYTFRSTDKDPSAVLHPDLQETFLEDIVQDQMAAQHPAGPLIANPIVEAAGVLTQQERFVVMPDDPALGKFREEFAGMLGTFYEFPQPRSDTNPGFHGATQILDHKELYERLAESPEDRVDAHAFLRARLVDILLGDFDRHRKQWRWVKLPGGELWQPLPEDRDLAFVRYEGVAVRTAHVYVPILQRYGPDYDDIKGLTLHGWEQDRWLLTGLEWSDWERTARDIQSRITDEVIDRAVAQQPPEYQALDAERLTRDLRGRRDRLVEGARKFYRHLARQVDVQATDASELVVAARDGETLTIEVAQRREDDTLEPPYFRRRFQGGETDEVRVYLREGDDRVVVKGGRSPIHLKVIGSGRGELDDREGGGTTLYDSAGGFTVLAGEGTFVDRRPYEPPASNAPAYLEAEEIPPRDWGSNWYPIPILGYEKDVGFFLGGGVLWRQYGFRKHPWSMQHLVTGGWAFEAEEPRVSYNGSYRRENSQLVGKLELRYSGIEVLGFFGFGNETSDSGSERFFRVRNEEYYVSPRVEFPLWIDELKLSVGPWLRHSDTKNGDRLIDLLDPYGAGNFGQIGATARLRFDTRTTVEGVETQVTLPLHDNIAAGYPTRGVFADVRGLVSPEVWDVESTYGSLRGSVAGYLSFAEDDRFTIAVRGGGEAVFGTYPYQSAAYLGGGGTFTGESTIRGYRQQRFAGDEMVFGNLDLRVFLLRAKLIFPTDVGVLGFADVGRVFLDGESSDDWHWGAGGGVWIAPLARTNAISVTVATSPEETIVYLRSGFHF